MLKGFKEFALKGNAIDLAIGVIIGGAFQKIVTSLVEDIIMPAISIFTGKIDYSSLSITIGEASIKYGSFITTIIDFLIIALSLFLFITYFNKLNKKLEKAKLDEISKINDKLTNNKFFKNKKKSKKNEEKSEPTTKICPYCVSEISIKATRCPHCTSVLEEENHEEPTSIETPAEEN